MLLPEEDGGDLVSQGRRHGKAPDRAEEETILLLHELYYTVEELGQPCELAAQVVVVAVLEEPRHVGLGQEEDGLVRHVL